jgi:hypothetical protein
MSTSPVSRAATTGLLGGVLWALLPFAWASAHIEDVRSGSVAWFGVVAVYWIFPVLAPVLIVAGLTALRRALGDGAGRLGRTGIAVSAVGLTAMALGNGIEVASMTAGGGEVSLGHALFLIGFLVSALGSVLVGIVVFRRRPDALSRIAALLLALSLPLGTAIAVVGSAIAPHSDAGFWAAISVPTGIAWVLLGRSLSVRRPAPVGEFATA